MFPLLIIHHFVSLMKQCIQIYLIMIPGNSYNSATETAGIIGFFSQDKLFLDICQSLLCILSCTVPHQNAKFISTNPGKNIFFTDIFIYDPDKKADICITLLMSKRIINIFQVIQVTVADRNRFPCLQNLFCFFFQIKTVANPGEHILIRFRSQLFFLDSCFRNFLNNIHIRPAISSCR